MVRESGRRFFLAYFACKLFSVSSVEQHHGYRVPAVLRCDFGYDSWAGVCIAELHRIHSWFLFRYDIVLIIMI